MKTLSDYEKEFDDWFKDQDTSYDIDENELKNEIETELSFLSSMTVEEYTLYKKWYEIHEKYPTVERQTLFGSEIQLQNIKNVKYLESLQKNIWGYDFKSDKDFLDSYLLLEPELVFANDNEYSQDWSALRVFTHTMRNNSNIGRNIHYIVRDKITKKYLGVVCLSSDFMDLTPRDSWIGWDKNIKTDQHMINHICICSTICPTQPLGYNFLGGKLLALLCVSKDVEKQWKDLYGDTLVGLTTTSLYGTFSQYDRLVYWKPMGGSSGSVTYEPGRSIMKKMMLWIKKYYPKKYYFWYHAVRDNGQPYKRDHRNRSFVFVYSKLGINKDYLRSNHTRGIYFCPLFNNTPDFLCKRIGDEKLERRFDNNISSLVDIWKTKYAKKRVEKLYLEKRIKPETLFYSDLIYLDWPETKKRFLSEVGR